MTYKETWSYEEMEDMGMGFMDSDGFCEFVPAPATSPVIKQTITTQKSITEVIRDAKTGWEPISKKSLLDKLPRRASRDEMYDSYNAPFQTEAGISVLVDAAWNETWREDTRYDPMSIALTAVGGVAIMKITNGYVDEPYYVRIEEEIDWVEYECLANC